jgi:hypothetical protein
MSLEGGLVWATVEVTMVEERMVTAKSFICLTTGGARCSEYEMRRRRSEQRLLAAKVELAEAKEAVMLR